MNATIKAEPKIAILMPVYNARDDAWRTIASIDEPTLSHVDILIIDDGSTPPFEADTAPDTLPPNIHINVIRLAHNGGIERALAQGVEHLLHAKVDLIGRIDAGDLSVPRRLAKQAAYFELHPSVGALGMWAQARQRTRVVDDDDKKADGGNKTDAWQPTFILRPPCTPADIRRQKFFRSCFIHPAMMMRADAVRRAGNYRPDFPAAEDLDLFLRIMQTSDCANLAEIGVVYELAPGGISATRRHKQIDSTWRLWRVHARLSNPYDWLGAVKITLHRLTPYPLLQRVKQFLLRTK